uniref:Uncharacterized protein n=1 Tax=Pyxicephalus adspersus TaxID=30357 RepID=A0AAV3BB73_PYXAD|nr:TPA: hypothetical protein GDO54_001527 [Pyxicephalus adspersus]
MCSLSMKALILMRKIKYNSLNLQSKEFSQNVTNVQIMSNHMGIINLVDTIYLFIFEGHSFVSSSEHYVSILIHKSLGRG